MKGKEIIEAALFVSSEPISVEKLGQLSKLSREEVLKAIHQLRQGYSKIGSVIEIREVGDGNYLMQVKDYLSETLVELVKPSLPQEVLKTLAYIAIRQPVLQSQVIKARGEKAYSHIKLLVEKEFVSAEPKGRTKLLTTTPKFSSYFGLSQDIAEIKKEIGKLMKFRE